MTKEEALDAILSKEEMAAIHTALDQRERLLAELVKSKGAGDHDKLFQSYERELATVKTATKKIRKAILGMS